MQTDALFDNEAEIARLRRVIDDNERHIAKLEHSLDVQIKLNIELAEQIRSERNVEKPLTKLTPEQLEMANDNIKLLYSFVNRNRIEYPSLEYGDIMGICAEGYCRAIQRYDPTKGTLGTFVYQYMRGYLLMYINRYVGPHNNLYLEDLGAGWVDYGGWEILIGSEPDKHTDQFEVEDALRFIDSFKRYGLKQVEIDTLKWFYLLQDQPAPTQIIGDKYGITYQAISYRLKVMREKLEPYKEDIRIAVSG